MVQLLICGVTFSLLVAVKLLLPAEGRALKEELQTILSRNMDIEAAFSAAGDSFSQLLRRDGREIVPPPQHKDEARLPSEPKEALGFMHRYKEELEEAKQKSDTTDPVCPLYTAETIPDQVTLEQQILGFPYRKPVEGTVASPFGYRFHPRDRERRFHYGVDLAAEKGAPVTSFAAGKVAAVGESSSYGKYCIVEHDGGYETLYAHCSRILASADEEVDLGQRIAEVGETGEATGPHLHFELHKNGTYLNPDYYVG